MSASPAPRSRRPTQLAIVLRVLGAAALAVSGWLHYDLATGPLVSDGQVTLAGLFIAQAVVAGLVALWVLVRGDRLCWVAVLLVGVASLVALVLSVYVKIPSIGPFPALYEPLWYAEKVVAAVSAGAAAIVALVAVRSP